MSNFTSVVRPEGNIDVTNSETFRQEMCDVLSKDVSTVLINCEAITFMDSSGLSAMVMSLKLAKELGVRLALCSVSEQAGMLFQLTGMDQVFEIFEDQAAFEAAVAQPA